MSDDAKLPVKERSPAHESDLSSPSSRRGRSGSSGRGRLLFWRVLSGVLLLAVIALCALLYSVRSSLFPREEEPSPEPEPVCYTAWCYTPLDEVLSVSAPAGEPVALPAGPQIDGYTFLRWEDAQGRIAEDGAVTLQADEAFRAVYAVAFRDESAEKRHEPYLSLADEQMFRPDGTLSRSETAELLYSFLALDLHGSGSFADVGAEASCRDAVATLKDLGVVEGSRFHPDDPITYAELFAMLSHFFPKSGAACSFERIRESDANYEAFCLAMERGWISDASLDPDSELTRAAAAHIFNLLLSRSPVAETDYAKVGTITDLSFDDPYFWDVAEAVIPHVVEQTEAGELWKNSEALPLREEGLFFIGTALHCADARGGAVIDASYGSFDFGRDGVITTGMPELDVLVQDKLKELVDPATMEPERMLYLLYNYVAYHHGYQRVHFYEVGDTSWVNEEAYHMFTVGKGNCYCFSSQFYVLARAIGFDAVIYSGTVSPNGAPHAWVEISFNGEPYIYDPELEYTQVVYHQSTSSYYKYPYWRAEGWHYYRGEQDAAADLSA